MQKSGTEPNVAYPVTFLRRLCLQKVGQIEPSSILTMTPILNQTPLNLGRLLFKLPVD